MCCLLVGPRRWWSLSRGCRLSSAPGIEPRRCASSRHFVPRRRAWGWVRAVGLEGDFGPLTPSTSSSSPWNCARPLGTGVGVPGQNHRLNAARCAGKGTRRGEGGTVGRKQESCQDKEFITEESCCDLTVETSEIFCVI